MTARTPRRAPFAITLVVVFLIGVTPVIAAAGLWRWAEAQITPIAPPPPVALAEDGPHQDVDGEPLFTWRRLARPIALDVEDQRRAESIDAAVGAVRDLDEGVCIQLGDPSELLIERSTTLQFDATRAEHLRAGLAALAVVGPTFVFTTELRGQVPVDGLVEGDLELLGGDDPLLVTRDWRDPHPPDGAAIAPVTELDILVDALLATGVTRIEGDVIGLAADDGALVVNQGELFGASRALNPTHAAASELTRLMRSAGIEVTGRPRSAPSPTADLHLLAQVDSAPLLRLVDHLLRHPDPSVRVAIEELGGDALGAVATEGDPVAIECSTVDGWLEQVDWGPVAGAVAGWSDPDDQFVLRHLADGDLRVLIVFSEPAVDADDAAQRRRAVRELIRTALTKPWETAVSQIEPRRLDS